MHILITGSTGFLGKYLVDFFSSNKIRVTSLVRNINKDLSSDIEQIVIYDLCNLELDSSSDYLRGILKSVDVVIHAAAIAHVTMDNFKPNLLVDFMNLNFVATINLAKLASESSVKRFIFISSIGVNGTQSSLPFSIRDFPAPVEDYAVSKLEAEMGLRKIAEESGMEVVIIRPPLVYGPNAPGNFGKLLQLTNKNLFLPFGAIHNMRSLVAVDNLVDLIATCVDHPNAANQTFLVSDDHDVSTTELLREMTLAAGKKPRLLPVPMSWLQLAGRLTGKQAVIDRLCGSLQVDISHTKDVLGWKPPVSFKEGIQKCFEKE